jgi:hypothetical protein
MFTVRVDTRPFDRAARRTEIILAEEMRKGVTDSAKKAAQHARANHTHKRRTGKLTSPSNLYHLLEYSGQQRAQAAITNVTPYARFVEYPTRPHIIRPKEGHGFAGPLQRGQSRRAITDIGTHRVALRWYVGNRPVFARKVRHPGTPGFPFMRPALKVGAEAFRRRFEVTTIRKLRRTWRTN